MRFVLWSCSQGKRSNGCPPTLPERSPSFFTLGMTIYVLQQGLPSTEKSFAHFLGCRTREVMDHGPWKLAGDKKSWVAVEAEAGHQPIVFPLLREKSDQLSLPIPGNFRHQAAASALPGDDLCGN